MIVLECSQWLLLSFRALFWYVFLRDWGPSHILAFTSPASGDLDAPGLNSKIMFQCSKQMFYHCIPYL